MNKVIEISLIENIEKKKKLRDNAITLSEYKKKIINDLEDVILLKFFENKNPEHIKQSDKFVDIRNRFVTFYNAYIEINKLFMVKNAENKLINDLIDDLVTTVIYRYENLNFNYSKDNIKEIQLLKEILEKKEGDKILVDMDI
jgi:hypothetical protein